MYLKKLIKKKKFKIKAKYIYKNKKGWVGCELLSIQPNDIGILLNIKIDDSKTCIYLENIKKGDIKI